MANVGPATLVIDTVADNGNTSNQRADAVACLDRMLTFDFVIIMFILNRLIDIIEVLSEALRQ